VLKIDSSVKVFVCSQLIDMRFSFDGLAGLVTTHFGMNPICGHIFVFFSRRRARMKVLFWEADGFALYYKRLERGSYSWILDLAFDENGEMQASDFALVLAGINPAPAKTKRVKKRRAMAPVAPLQLV
jgi:transposase